MSGFLKFNPIMTIFQEDIIHLASLGHHASFLVLKASEAMVYWWYGHSDLLDKSISEISHLPLSVEVS